MEYTQELEKYKTKNGNYHIKKITYYLKKCFFCEKTFLSRRKDGKYCSLKCSQTKENHNNWKGGVKKLNIPLYDTYASQLEPIEKCRKAEEGYLEVKCAYCGRWYIPKRNIVDSRIQVIKGNYKGEQRFYCDKDCKLNCPIYNRVKYEKGYKPSTSREVQPELRQLVFKRDEYQCVKCGATNNLHCHHIEGLNQNPLESADMDLCITLCKDCHKEVHKQKNCRYNDMKCYKVISPKYIK